MDQPSRTEERVVFPVRYNRLFFWKQKQKFQMKYKLAYSKYCRLMQDCYRVKHSTSIISFIQFYKVCFFHHQKVDGLPSALTKNPGPVIYLRMMNLYLLYMHHSESKILMTMKVERRGTQASFILFCCQLQVGFG